MTTPCGSRCRARIRSGGGRGVGLSARVHDAEAVALGVGEDHVVRVRGPLVPLDLGRPERQQAFDLSGCRSA